MPAYAITLLEHDQRSELLRWGTAAMVVLALHLGLATLHLLLPSNAPQGAPEAPAVIIDLAPLPVAPASPMDITPGPEAARAGHSDSELRRGPRRPRAVEARRQELRLVRPRPGGVGDAPACAAAAALPGRHGGRLAQLQRADPFLAAVRSCGDGGRG